MIYLKAYTASLVIFLILDSLWLGVVARGFYASELGDLLRANINFLAAAGFYAFYVAGIVYFAVHPALTANSLGIALLNGALFGLLAYGTYDMTNLATLKNWPLTMSLVDMAWGTVLTATAAAAGFLFVRNGV